MERLCATGKEKVCYCFKVGVDLTCILQPMRMCLVNNPEIHVCATLLSSLVPKVT